MRFDIVERFVADSTGEGGVACDDHKVLVTATQVAPDSHAERCGKRGSCVAGAITVVVALGVRKKTVEPAELAQRMTAIQPPGRPSVHVAIVADGDDGK